MHGDKWGLEEAKQVLDRGIFGCKYKTISVLNVVMTSGREVVLMN